MVLCFKTASQYVLLTLNWIHSRLWLLLLTFLLIPFRVITKAWSLTWALDCIVGWFHILWLSILILIAFEICSFTSILGTIWRQTVFIVAEELLRLSWLGSIDIVGKHCEIKCFAIWLTILYRDHLIIVRCCLSGWWCCRWCLILRLPFLFEYALFLTKLYSATGTAHLRSLATFCEDACQMQRLWTTFLVFESQKGRIGGIH